MCSHCSFEIFFQNFFSRPPSKQGPILHIVASEFNDLVVKSQNDVLTYIYPKVDFWKKTIWFQPLCPLKFLEIITFFILNNFYPPPPIFQSDEVYTRLNFLLEEVTPHSHFEKKISKQNRSLSTLKFWIHSLVFFNFFFPWFSFQKFYSKKATPAVFFPENKIAMWSIFLCCRNTYCFWPHLAVAPKMGLRLFFENLNEWIRSRKSLKCVRLCLWDA